MAADPHVVIIGGGFGGLHAALTLPKRGLRVTLIDRTNHHLFQPLLYQVATGGLSPGNIAVPLRGLMRRRRNVDTLMATVRRIDPAARTIVLHDGHELTYDYCIVAAGARTNWFGKAERWGSAAPGMKSLDDALYLRRRIFSAFEAAERAESEERRRALLSFVVVGGGPTGVELAGAIAELANHTLRKDFRHFDPATAIRVQLAEADGEVLGPFPDSLRQRAADYLRGMGVELRLNTFVSDVSEGHVRMRVADGSEVEEDCGLLIWAAGVEASPLATSIARSIGQELKPGGRVAVEQHCTLPGHPDTFVIGDMAWFADLSKHDDPAEAPPLPGVAPTAMQQGRYCARVIKRRLRGRDDGKPFRYWDKGSMATVGRNKAVAASGPFRFTGWIAWLAWLFVHIMYLAGGMNRLLVLIQWAWAYTTRNRNARLITGAQLTDRQLIPDETDPDQLAAERLQAKAEQDASSDPGEERERRPGDRSDRIAAEPNGHADDASEAEGNEAERETSTRS